MWPIPAAQSNGRASQHQNQDHKTAIQAMNPNTCAAGLKFVGILSLSACGKQWRSTQKQHEGLDKAAG
jgi:hypothetical protein